jgi:hypothetical protein
MNDEKSRRKSTGTTDWRVRVPTSLDRQVEQLARKRFYTTKADFLRDLARREVAASIKVEAMEMARPEGICGGFR